MNEQITIKELFSLDKTIAAGIFEGAVYPWEVLSKIGDYIVGLGNSLPTSSLLNIFPKSTAALLKAY